MGQSKSKSRKSSYDITPVESDKNLKVAKAAPKNKKNDAQPVLAVPECEEPQIGIAIDASVVPAWVTEAAFVDVVKQHVENFEQIKSFRALPALAAGENFATLMLRISIDVELKDKSSKSLSYMLKTAHDTETMKSILENFNFFKIENAMYFEVIPLLEQMYRDKGLEIVFAPKAYRFPQEPSSVLLEDLKPHGFKNTNRFQGLDMEHAEQVLKKLGKFHAASASCIAKLTPFSSTLMDVLYGDHIKEIYERIFSSFKPAFLDNLKSYKDGEKYYEIVKTYFANLSGEIAALSKYDVDEFNVIIHADCWSNNILFKYTADGKVDDLNFVDFQGPKFGPPAMDIIYFILTSVRLELKLSNFDHFIRVYYDSLIEGLKLCGYPKKPPTLREIHMQLFKNGAMALFPTIFTLPVVLLDSSEVSKFDNFMADDEAGKQFRSLLLTNERYRAQIDELLPWLYNRGLLEYVSVDIQTDTIPTALASKNET